MLAKTEFDSLGQEAIIALRKFFTIREPTSLVIGAARVAASALGAWTRYCQTETSRESNFLMLARELAEDKEEFRKFVKLGMPNAPIVQALPAKRS